MTDPEILGAVLAGGGSRRFGSPKALALFRGEAMGLRAARVLAEVAERVVVVTSVPEVAAALGGGATPVRVIPDRVPGAGPLAGLHAALHHALGVGARGVLVLGCDMPLVTPDLLALLVQEGRRSDRPATVAASGSGRLQPLCGWYGAESLPVVERRLRGEDRSMAGLLRELEADPVSPVSARETGQHGELRSANTPDELRSLEALVS